MAEATINIEDVPTQTPDVTVKLISVIGQLDESNVDQKAQEIYKVIEANPKNLYLVFNFENLEYMNSKSIGYLTDWYGKVSDNGGKIVIAKAKENILDVLQVVGLTQLIKAYNSIEEAKAGLSS